jgi:hypothetical protein
MYSTSFAIVAVAILGGCAFDDLTVRTPPRQEITAGSRRGEGREVGLIKPFRNGRRQTRCGMQKNGFNMDTANVICRDTPESMLADLLGDELLASGFRVLADPARASRSTLMISGAVEQAFVEPKLNYGAAASEADIALKLTVWTASGLLAERSFYVKGDEAAFFTGEAAAQKAFNSAVRQLLASVVGAIANLADRVPVQARLAVTPAHGVVP